MPNGDLYLGFYNTADFEIGYTNTVTNNGSATAYPDIHIKRVGGTSAKVTRISNDTTDTTMSFNYSLLDGEELIIRTSPGGRTIYSTYYGTVWRAILRGSDFAQFNLMPGVNLINIFVTSLGAPTVTCWMTWKQTHWASDMVA
jgi:hypothetical protein